jgi:hypothetical protein
VVLVDLASTEADAAANTVERRPRQVAMKHDMTVKNLFKQSHGTSMNHGPTSQPFESFKGSAQKDCDVRSGEPEIVKINSLVLLGSPRSNGIDNGHVERLAEAEWPLPPILVHRPTMRVIDGFHRVCAAKCKGLEEIAAILLDGSLESVFIVAVEANVRHGLPLPIGDRRAAAARILQTHSDWSDRAVSTSTGLSAKTVRSIRRSTADNPQLNKRVGKDGRVRPLNAAAGRHLAAQLLSARPDASLREIANTVGMSPATVRDVRQRLNRGEEPVAILPCSDRVATADSGRKDSAAITSMAGPEDVSALLAVLSRDPALRMSEVGRKLLRWLHLHAVTKIDSAMLVNITPEHCVPHLIELANRCAANWAWIADDLAQRSTHGHMSRGGSAPEMSDMQPTNGTEP